MALSRVVSEIFNVENVVTLNASGFVFHVFRVSGFMFRGQGSLKVIENYTIRSGTHDFPGPTT